MRITTFFLLEVDVEVLPPLVLGRSMINICFLLLLLVSSWNLNFSSKATISILSGSDLTHFGPFFYSRRRIKKYLVEDT
jgi:hypothetical protein